MISKLPDTVSDSEAANLQPASDCVCFVESADMRLGDSVAIYGSGCLGMFTMQIANSTGAGQTIIVDVKDEILELAKKFGATHTINGSQEDPVQKILDLTNGFGADIVVEAAGGNPQRGLSGLKTFNQAVLSVRPEGTLFPVAMYAMETDSIEIPWNAIRSRGKRICTPKHTELKYLERAINLMAKKQLQVAEMVTHSFDGIEHVLEMYEITANKKKFGVLNPAQVVIQK